MKHILHYLLWLCLSIEVANAQTNIQSVIAIFAEKPSVEWAPPIPNSPSILVQWQARTTSKEFRSFVGYYQDHFVGVISFDKQQLSGEVFYRGNSYVLGTSPQGILTVEAVTDEHDCGASSLGKQALSARNFFPEDDEDKNDPPIEQPEIYNSLYPKALIHTDGVFRHYRLAIPVDYSYYNSKRFNREINKIKTFWYATITFLNELYRNDVGVDFTLVDDEALIITTPEKEMFRRGTPANDVVDDGTNSLNKRYDKNKYDIAVIITDYRENYNGLAAVYAAYEQHQKANAAARPIKPSTIAHEIGHMFGADHTFSNGGQYSSKTETGSGQSIMSYGHEHPRDFFSLISLQEIRKFLGNSMAYYADEARTQEAGKRVEGTGSNLVYGVKSNNRPPVLDRTHLKKTYTIPEETYFQFYLNATDPEGDALTYIAHPADRRFHSTKSNARFITYKGRAERNIRFETTWFESERNTFVPIGAADSYKEGTFTFWLAAADHNKSDSNHVVKYDVEEVQVKILKGKPFEIQNFDNGSWEQNKTYKGGQTILLHWQVDEAIFTKDSKVRILLSTDSGKTYKYVLKKEVANNGTCQVELPNISVGTTRGHFGKQRGQGIIKIEVIDGLAYALSCTKPYHVGGFMIQKDPTKPETTPEPEPQPNTQPQPQPQPQPNPTPQPNPQPNPQPQPSPQPSPQPQPSPSDSSDSSTLPNATAIIYNAVSTTNPENYFKIENTDEDRPISVLIFDEMGLKVYENNYYGKNGEVFRGYSNLKTISNKPLAGTYFYIVAYYKDGNLEEKKGFLYVR